MVWALLNQEQHIALTELIEGQASDRIVAIVGGAMLEDGLRQALQLRLRPKSGKTNINEMLFKPGGPIGTLQPKVLLAYQLYMIEKPQRNAMTGIADIRNCFAHQLDTRFSSDDEKMNAAFNKLTLHEGKEYYPHPILGGHSDNKIETISSLREQFLVNLKLCLINIMEDQRRHVPWTNNPY